MDSDTKTCRRCAEAIKSTAKVCPHCGLRQSWYALWQQDVPILFGCVLMCMATVPLFWMLPDEKSVGGRKFSGHRDEIAVLDTSLDRPGVKSEFYLTGVVTNRGDHAWRVHGLEIRFLDAQGKLLDVRNHSVTSPFVVLPRHEHGFRAQIDELAFTNSNVSHQVRVQEATDGDRPLKPD